MTQEQHEAIQKRGANAQAIGQSMLDNPYLKSDQMPAATGQTIEEWTEQHDAWALGWSMENAMSNR